MRSRTILLLGLAAASGCRPPEPPAPAPACPAVTPALVDAGREVFGRANCALCHGPDGRGKPVAPDLGDAAWLHGDGSVQSIAAVLRSGVPNAVRHPGGMPARGGVSLDGDEICALAAYVHSLSADPAAPGGGR